MEARRFDEARHAPFGLALDPVSFALVAFAISDALPVHAQTAQIDALATQVAGAINHSKEKQKRTAVFDFGGPNPIDSQIDRNVADEFSAALAKHGSDVVDRTTVVQALAQGHIVPWAASGPDTATIVAQDLNASFAVVGYLVKKSDNNIELAVDSYSSAKEKPLAGFNVLLPFTEEMKAEASHFFLVESEKGHPDGGHAGFSNAVCIACPLLANCGRASTVGAC